MNVAIKIEVPNKNFNGIRGGVQFEKGVGIFEDEEAGKKLAIAFGYKIVEEKKEKPKTTSTKKKTTKSTKKSDK